MASRRDNKILESKVILLGEARVGKSSIINRFINDQFDPNSKPTTIGGNQQAYSDKIIQVFNGGKIKINLWDTAGQEIFSSIVSVYYKSAQAAIVVFDLTDRNTINKAHKWIQEVQNNNETKDCKIILVGNKQDKNNERQIKTEEGQEIAKQYKIKYYETSAKNAFNIKELFSDLAEELYTDNKNANKKPSRITIDNFQKDKDKNKKTNSSDTSCSC
ncbi:hypothetical protein ABPG74_002382 [Tetrahymena malaccensis]